MWILLWGTAPLFGALLLAGLLGGNTPRFVDLSGLFLAQGVLSYAVILLLWGLGRLSSRARDLQPQLERLAGAGLPSETLSGTGSLAGPLILTAVIVGSASVRSLLIFGAIPTIGELPLLVLTVLPIATFVWVFLALLVGLNRLGSVRLQLEPFPHDRNLGLGPVGALAFTGFWLTFAAIIPVVVSSALDLWTFAEGVLVLLVTVVAFLLSMWKLHIQMARMKARYVAETGALYAAAYDPLRNDGTLEVLATQAPLLAAAQALTERAQSIQEWPIDDRIAAIMGFIVAGVASGLIVRFASILTHV